MHVQTSLGHPGRRAGMPSLPGDVIDVIAAGVDRDDQPCPWEDKVHTLLDVIFGGLATTTHAMSGAIMVEKHR